MNCSCICAIVLRSTERTAANFLPNTNFRHYAQREGRETETDVVSNGA